METLEREEVGKSKFLYHPLLLKVLIIVYVEWLLQNNICYVESILVVRFDHD